MKIRSILRAILLRVVAYGGILAVLALILWYFMFRMPGDSWSDHWAFWQAGYDALMVTDTAPFRYPHYHLATDTPDKVDYERLARVVAGLEHVIRDLATVEASE